MADYFTHFSVILPRPDTEELEKKSRQFVDEFNEKQGKQMSDFFSGEDDCEIYSGLKMTYHKDGVFIEDAYGEGNPEAAMVWIERYLDELDMDCGVLLAWACTCSKHRPGAFSGGGAVIDRNGVRTSANSYHAVAEAEKLGIEVHN